MSTLFCVRPATRNIGNDLIGHATTALLVEHFGADTSVVTIPALADGRFGGFTAAQVHDMNRFADGVVVAGGNLFENGQFTIDRAALAALRVPLMIVGVSHGRIFDDAGELVERTDAMPAATITALAERAVVSLVRDEATCVRLRALGVADVQTGGCPTLFLREGRTTPPDGGRVLLSLRHPALMNVPPRVQWRVADDVRRLIASLEAHFGCVVTLVCHDYRDLAFAAGFPDTPQLYFDDVRPYVAALRSARLSVGYRLHASLPAFAFGTPAVNISYDERSRAALATAGLGEWDIDLMRSPDVVAVVMSRVRDLDRYDDVRAGARRRIETLRERTNAGFAHFRAHVLGEAEAAHAWG
jgi:hypothetical protein